MTVHDLRFIDEARGLKRLLFWLGWIVLPLMKADRVTVISDFTRRRLLAYAPFAKGKIRVIPNCVAPEFVPNTSTWNGSKPRILLVGTTPNKNLSRMAEVCQGLNVKLTILGLLDDDQRNKLKGLDYEELPNLTREDVVSVYQRSDLVAFVSTYEGFGLPIIEAQAVGRPVLTSNIPPMSEIVGRGGLLVDPFDVDAIRSGIVRLLTETSLREDLVREGFVNVAKYSAEAVAAQYADLYREILDSR